MSVPYLGHYKSISPNYNTSTIEVKDYLGHVIDVQNDEVFFIPSGRNAFFARRKIKKVKYYHHIDTSYDYTTKQTTKSVDYTKIVAIFDFGHGAIRLSTQCLKVILP